MQTGFTQQGLNSFFDFQRPDTGVPGVFFVYEPELVIALRGRSVRDAFKTSETKSAIEPRSDGGKLPTHDLQTISRPSVS
jgi:hypothetical protein